MKILAAIVTFNRHELLSRCIDHVQAQTRRPDALWVINNGSTDGTVEMLGLRGVDVITQENVGSAGGWHRAIQKALDMGCDAVWLMDDDGFPDADALANLERALSPGVACVSSVVLREDAPDRFVFPFPVLDITGMPVILGRPRKLGDLNELKARSQGGVYPFVHLFNGALIAMDAVRRVGNVERNFFVYGEEVDFFFRLRHAGKVLSVLVAKHFHPDVSNRPYNPMKVYYYIKNTLILNTRYYNLVWLRHGFMISLILIRLIRRNGFGFLFSLLVGTNARAFYKAIFRGITGKLGKDFYG
jgi:rhamnopyranosyl-N-acetylglucosaminyl-diphospho-decaprenol beta-1,3/1,4-galactofuranosyltransferase